MSTFEELNRLAEQGDIDAQFMLGIHYIQEAHTAHSSLKSEINSNAARLFEEIVNNDKANGHEHYYSAMWYLAKLHTQSNKIFGDAEPEKAIELYERIIKAQPDDLGAKLDLGVMYCTAGVMEHGEAYTFKNKSRMERNIKKGRELLKDILDIDLNRLPYDPIRVISEIYLGGWLNERREPTIKDLIKAITYLNRQIILAGEKDEYKSEFKKIIELTEYQVDVNKKRIKADLSVLKADCYLVRVQNANAILPMNKEELDYCTNSAGDFDEELIFKNLRADGLADIADELRQEWNESEPGTQERGSIEDKKPKEIFYTIWLEKKESASTESEFRDLAKNFRSLNGYKDSDALAQECQRIADQKIKKIEDSTLSEEQKERQYKNLILKKASASTENDFRNLANEFEELGYKNSYAFAHECRSLADEIKKKVSETDVSKPVNPEVTEPEIREPKEDQDQHEIIANKRRNILVSTILIAAAIALVMYLLYSEITPQKTDDAQQTKEEQARIEKENAAEQARIKEEADRERERIERETAAEQAKKEAAAATDRAWKSFDTDMVLVQGGIFTMGCTPEQGRDCSTNETPTSEVTLNDFYIGKYEVTQAQWRLVMGNNPSVFKGDNLPVENVSWNDVQGFINRLNQRNGGNFRLPTEAEWEYAARGGNKSQGYKYSGNNNIGEVAWYENNSSKKTNPVGTKKANELGIHDMSGNVYEWVHDWYEEYSGGQLTNPQGPSSGSYRVSRGGSLYKAERGARVSARDYSDPSYSSSAIGFRLAVGITSSAKKPANTQKPDTKPKQATSPSAPAGDWSPTTSPSAPSGDWSPATPSSAPSGDW